jgi:FPC/CPF motif-containing protein YcgG
MPIPAPTDARILAFDQFVRGGSHPCVMARSVLTRHAVTYGTYAELGSPQAASALCRDLCAAAQSPSRSPGVNWSFVALFTGATPPDEISFERDLWAQLQAMHEWDSVRHGWDQTVDRDPASAKFSFSIGGTAWYVIGLHPAASRTARRFESVALVFNPHSQFERLRERGKYGLVKEQIRERDAAVQGSINPMLADHGQISEARQYSGRAVGENWICPLHVHSGEARRGIN